MAKFHIIFGTADHRATIERPGLYLGYVVPSVAFVCPCCLEVWAYIPKDEDYAAYHIQATSCHACSPTHWILNPIPGSILDNSLFNSLDFDLLEALPEYLVQREYNLHLAQYDRYRKNEPAFSPDDYGNYTSDDIEAFNAAWCRRRDVLTSRSELPS